MIRPARSRRDVPSRTVCGALSGLGAGLALAVSLQAAEPPPPILGPTLHDGFTYEHALAPGELYAFPVEMKAGEYLQVEVDGIGLDIVVRLVDAAGTEIAQADSLSLVPVSNQTERFAATVPRDGKYDLRVETENPGPEEIRPAGARIRLRAHGLRNPTAEDRAYLRATDLLHSASVDYYSVHDIFDDPRLEKAAEKFDQAIPVFRALGEPDALAYCLLWSSVARTQRDNVDWAAAVKALEEAIAILERPRDPVQPQELNRALVTAAGAHIQLHEWEPANRQADRALAIALQIPDDDNLPEIYLVKGRARSGIGSFVETDEALKEAMRRFDAAGQSKVAARGRIRTLIVQGANFVDSKRYRQSLAAYSEALRLANILQEPWLQAVALNNLGDFFGHMGEYRKALEYQSQMLKVEARLQNPNRRLIALHNIAISYRFLGDYPKSESFFQQALQIEGATYDSFSAALAASSFLYTNDLNLPEKGMELALRSIETARGNKLREALGRHAYALALRKLGQPRASRLELERSLELTKDSHESALQAEILLTLARVDRDEGKLGEGLKDIRASIGLVEDLREGIRLSQTLRASFLALRQAQYDFYIDLLMELDRSQPDKSYAEQAFDVSETSLARTLLETMEQSPDALRPETQGRDHLRDLSNRLGEAQLDRQRILEKDGPDSVEAGEALTRLEGLLFDYEALLGSQPAGRAQDLPSNSLGPQKLNLLQSSILGKGVLLLEYRLGPERSYLWAVTPERTLAFQLPARSSIDSLARDYYELLTARNRHPIGEIREAFRSRVRRADKALQTKGQELSQILLAPVSALLKEPLTSLLIVGDGALNYIPFATLPVPGGAQPLLSKTRVVDLPSASILAAIRSRGRSSSGDTASMALFAAPLFQAKVASADRSHLASLPWAEREARAIAALVPADQRFLALGAQASRLTLDQTDLASYRLLHFATHGLVDSERPELSSLVLSLANEKGMPADGYLRLMDIYSLRLNANLVTLSACRTALGKDLRGEGPVGLARGFLAAGARRVIASLWSVEDRATAKLMESLYRGILKGRLPPSEALRQAQLEMRRDPLHASPYFWAAFTLQGEWQ